MKALITVDRKELVKTLKKLTWKTNHYCLCDNYCMFQVNQDCITIRKSDSYLFLSVNLRAHIQGEGQFILPLKEALKILKSINKDIVTIFFDDQHAQIDSVHVDLLPLDDFPIFPNVDTFNEVGFIPGSVFEYFMKLSKKLPKHETINSYAIDGDRMLFLHGSFVLEVPIPGIKFTGMIDESLKYLVNFIDGDFFIGHDTINNYQYLSFRNNVIEAVVRVHRQPLPDYKKVIPEKGHPLHVNINQLIDGMKAVKSITKKGDIPITVLKIGNDKDVLVCDDGDYNYCNEIEGSFEFPLTIGMDTNLVLPILSEIDTRYPVSLFYMDDHLPFVITDGTTFRFAFMLYGLCGVENDIPSDKAVPIEYHPNYYLIENIKPKRRQKRSTVKELQELLTQKEHEIACLKERIKELESIVQA